MESYLDGIKAPGGWTAPSEVEYDLLGMDSIPFNNKQTTWNPKLSKEERFLTMAMGVALNSKCRFRHGAIVVKHGRVLGGSCNIEKNNPKYVDYRHSSVHAEIAAMRKAGWPRRVSLYVARVNSRGEARLSKPCANCQAVLDEFKVKVFWTES
jgi:cytidine deaminase